MALQEIKTGKKAGVITYKVGDTYLVREYTPKVHNPNTLKQVQQRAKIKLLSQITALMRFYIAIFPSSGKSARSIFQRLNYPFITAQNTIASLNFSQMLLSESVRPLPQVEKDVIPIDTRFRKYIHFLDEPTADIKRVFYFLFTKSDDNKLTLVECYLSERRTTPTARGFFNWAGAPFEVDTEGKSLYDYVVYAVGMGDNSEEATEYFLNLDVDYIEQVGRLISEKLISSADYYFTETKSLLWHSGD